MRTTNSTNKYSVNYNIMREDNNYSTLCLKNDTDVDNYDTHEGILTILADMLPIK